MTGRESLFPLPSRDQTTHRGGGAFYPDTGKPMHYTNGSGLCLRCQTPSDNWRESPCYYPMTMAEAVEETAAFLESCCTTTVSATVKECCERARVLRLVLRYGR